VLLSLGIKDIMSEEAVLPKTLIQDSTPSPKKSSQFSKSTSLKGHNEGIKAIAYI
jgi:hypothetical protein